ncbi:venom allergen 5 [Scaptodrosophila lebanonensis]|uniref:Venom allergen 5 n=1 Tax=Drosophila lebanonensis TaxID=7225 RepID=A0A6J2TQV4_DROLE|nr:venom allergen 5 [Scaptodrosophila lebanonensis]
MSCWLYTLSALCILANLLAPSVAWNYCSEHWCKEARSHIACNNNGSYGRSCSKEAELRPLNVQLRNFILHKINFYRNKVASGNFSGFAAAHRMASVQWDPELATLAELAVKQCPRQPDECRNTRRFKHVGQILGHVIFSTKRYSDIQLLEHKLGNWFRQYKRANSQLNAVEGGPDITSFRQLMQERATHIGCGILRHVHRHRWHKQFIVCNFARENIGREPVYGVATKPASGCKMGVNPKFPNLCALHEAYDVNVVDHLAIPRLRIKLKYNEEGMHSKAAANRTL